MPPRKLLGILAIICCLLLFYIRYFMYNSNTNHHNKELIGVYVQRKGVGELKHLDLVEFDKTFVAIGSLDVHTAHVEGHAHVSMYMFLLDVHNIVLLMYRSKDMKTCPSSWGLIGEHMALKEAPEEVAKRAILEELNIAPDLILKSENLFQGKTAMFIDTYENGRKDIQATYLWYVKLSKSFTEIKFHLEEETVGVKYVTLQDLKHLTKTTPEQFCNEKLLSLLVMSLDALLKLFV